MFKLGDKVYVEFEVVSTPLETKMAYYGVRSSLGQISAMVEMGWLEYCGITETLNPEVIDLRERIAQLEHEGMQRIITKQGSLYSMDCQRCGQKNIIDPAIFEAYMKEKGMSHISVI